MRRTLNLIFSASCRFYQSQGNWQRPLILPLFGFPWSPQLRNLSSIRELWRSCAKRAANNNNFNNKKFRRRSDPTRWSEYSLLVLLVIGLVSAVTNFYHGDLELTFSFLLVLRLSLHAVYYAKNETSEQSLFLDADLLTRCASLDAGSQTVFLLRRPTRLIEGPTLQYVCRRVYIFKWKAQN